MSAVRMGRVAALGLLLLGTNAGLAARAEVPAADPAHLAAASRLVADTGGKARMEQMMTAMRGIMVQLISAHGKDAAESGRIVDQVLLPAMRAHLPELETAFTRIWGDAMTTEQLDTADAFYRSPTGVKLVQVTAKTLPEFMALGRAWGQQVAKEVLALQREALRQRGITL